MTSDPGGQGIRVRCGGSLLQKRKHSLKMKGQWPRAVSFANLSVPHIHPQTHRPGKEEKQVPVQTGLQAGSDERFMLLEDISHVESDFSQKKYAQIEEPKKVKPHRCLEAMPCMPWMGGSSVSPGKGERVLGPSQAARC